MYLHLRWFGINVEPYRMKTINIMLPRKDYEYLKEIFELYRIPYSDVFRQAIFHFKRYVLRQYFRDLKRSRQEDIQENARISISEEMDEILQRAFRDSMFRGPKIAFYTSTHEDRVRICLRMTTWDHQFLLKISNPGTSVSDCLGYLLKRMRENIIRKSSHKKITFGIRMSESEALNEFMNRYHTKYGEKTTKSEVIVFAYYLFRRKKGLEQQKLMRCERLDGKGGFKKISISFLWPGYADWKRLGPAPQRLLGMRRMFVNADGKLNQAPDQKDEEMLESALMEYFDSSSPVDTATTSDHIEETGIKKVRRPQIAELRAALYYFLRQERTWELVKDESKEEERISEERCCADTNPAIPSKGPILSPSRS